MGQVAADFEHLGEDEEQHPEERERADQRPQVAEHRAEVHPLELGHRHQPEQVEEAAWTARERARAAPLAQLRRRSGRRGGAHGAPPPSIETSVVRGNRTKPWLWPSPKTRKSSARST